MRRILQELCRSLEKSPKSGMVQRGKCRSRQELSNEYLLANFGFDTAEHEPPKGFKTCMLYWTPLVVASARCRPWGGAASDEATSLAGSFVSPVDDKDTSE